MMNKGTGIQRNKVLLITVGAVLGFAIWDISSGRKQCDAVTKSVKRLGDNFKSYLQQAAANSTRQRATVDNNPGFHRYTIDEVWRYEDGFAPMDDPGLIRFIQQRHLIEPSTEPADLDGPGQHKSQVGQSQLVDKLLKQKRNGFFVEVGARDGVGFSNSYFFEKYRGWKGLLIEGNTEPFQNILLTRKASYAINACVGTTNKTRKVKFFAGFGGYHKIAAERNKKGTTHVLPSFPLYSLLKAIGVDTVDYFSLDIEGLELEVLKTIPFDKVRINIITIEYAALPHSPNGTQQTTQNMKGFMDFFTKLGLYNRAATLKNLDIVLAR